MDASNHSLRNAARIAQESLEDAKLLGKLRGRTLYAVGGTWRALAKLHMRQRNYLLSIMHGYNIPAREAADFAGLVERVNTDALIAVEAVTAGAASAACLWRDRSRRDHFARRSPNR